MGIATLFNTVATVLAFTPSDGSWGSVDSYQETASVPCRIRRLSARESVDGKVRTQATMRAYLPCSTELTRRDRLMVDGIVYNIIGDPYNAGGGAGHHLEVELEAAM